MAGSSGAVRAGAAFVEVWCKDGALRKGLDAAEARVRSFGGKMAKMGAAIAGAGAVVSGPLAIAKKFAIDDGAEVSKLARDLGTTAEELTAFGAAAAGVGVPFDALNGYLASLPTTLSNLADGSDASADMLRRLGVPARELINLPFGQQMEMLAQAVSKVSNPIDRARVATELFGESGRDLLPLLEQGAAGVRGLTDAAKATGQVMTGEQAARAAAQRALNSAWESARKAVAEVGMALIPSTEVIAKFSAQFQAGAAAVRDFVRENAAIIAIVGAAATGVVALGRRSRSWGASWPGSPRRSAPSGRSSVRSSRRWESSS